MIEIIRCKSALAVHRQTEFESSANVRALDDSRTGTGADGRRRTMRQLAQLSWLPASQSSASFANKDSTYHTEKVVDMRSLVHVKANWMPINGDPQHKVRRRACVER